MPQNGAKTKSILRCRFFENVFLYSMSCASGVSNRGAESKLFEIRVSIRVRCNYYYYLLEQVILSFFNVLICLLFINMFLLLK